MKKIDIKSLIGKIKGRGAGENVSIGLDIGTSVVKFVKLRFVNESPELLAFGFIPADAGLESGLKEFREAHKVNRVNVAVSSGPAVVVRYIHFPKMTKEELTQSLKFEAQKHIPFSVDEVFLDSYILKDDLADNKMIVLVAAVKKDFLNQHLSILKAAEFNLNVVDIDSIALINAFVHSQAGEIENKTVALLNIGAAESNLSVLEKGIPIISRDIHIGGNNFTRNLEEHFKIDFKAAEKMKFSPSQDDKLLTSVESVFIHLASEIRVSFDYYESREASSVEKIYLDGGGSLFPGLKNNIADTLGLAVEYWNPFNRIVIGNSVDSNELNKLASQLSVAVGAALRK